MVDIKKDNEQVELLMHSTGRKMVVNYIDKMIEDRRRILEKVDSGMKKVEYDSYDLTRIDIDNLRALKNIPKKLIKGDGIGVIDMGKQV